jgi:hypothetical protein
MKKIERRGKPSNNTTGVLGVHPYTPKSGPKVWRATWGEIVKGKKKYRSKAFPYRTREEKKTQFEAAVKHRKKMERLHYAKKP